MNIAMAWPVALVVLSNILYQITAKLVPQDMDPFANFTVTYLVASITSAIIFFATARDTTLIREYAHINWATILLGISVVGLETGFIFAYKAGWQVSTLSTVQSGCLAIALIFVGYLLFEEIITPTKVAGVLICLVGLFFLNK